uniref:Uncharacterized protein n=1 Tax=Rhizophora mucronata TaxID=61149 RepID=A0A2P2PXQ8_RHIMU
MTNVMCYIVGLLRNCLVRVISECILKFSNVLNSKRIHMRLRATRRC